MDEQLRGEISRLSLIVTEEDSYMTYDPGKIVGHETEVTGYGSRDGWRNIPIYEGGKDVEKTRPKYSDNERVKAKKELIAIYNGHDETRDHIIASGGISKRDVFNHNHPTLSDALVAGGFALGCGGILVAWGAMGYGGFKLLQYLAQFSD